MKRVLSLIFSIIMCFSFLSLSGNTAFASEKQHIEDVLVALEKEQGYIPGKASSVQYNCFAFVSDVCEKIYGVTYAYEQQTDNYQFKHTENYYTVSKLKLSYSSDYSQQKENAKKIRDWLLTNAAAGDILQYGSASSSYNKRHTVLIQHIDDKKMQVLHSNYETMNTPASACRLDTVYFDNFVSNPLSNEYDSNGNIKSMNYLLGSQLKLEQGCGLSLNRFTNLESRFYLDKMTSSQCRITKTERTSCTSVKVYWSSVPLATAYSVDYKLSTASKWTNASKTVVENSFDITNLKPGKEYSFRVRAYVNGQWQSYCDVVTKTVLPPKPANITVNVNSKGITLNWAKRSDITGVLVFKSTGKDKEFVRLADITDNSVSSFTDSDITINKDYYYKIQRYQTVGANTYYSEMSPVFSGSFALSAPENLTVKSTSKSSMYVEFDKVENAKYYVISYCEKGKSDYKKITTKKTSKAIKELKVGVKYRVRVRSVSDFGGTANSPLVYCTVKPKTTKIKTSTSDGKAVVSWEKKETVSGYAVYRAYSKNGSYELVKTVKGNKTFSYKDNKTYKGNKYYYKVRSYVNRNGKAYYSDFSSPKCVKLR